MELLRNIMAAKKMPKPFVKAMEKQFPKGATITPAKGKALFGGKETKAEEAKEKKAFPGKSYAKAEAKFEPKGKPFKCGGKVKKYAEGGLAEIGDVEEGKPAGGRFSEDTYARARAFAKAAEREEPVKVSKPARAAAKPEPKEEVIQPRTKADYGNESRRAPAATNPDYGNEGRREVPMTKAQKMDDVFTRVRRGIDAGGKLGEDGPTFIPGPATNKALTAVPKGIEMATKAVRAALPGPRASATALPSPTSAAQATRVGTNPTPKALPKPREQASTWKSRESANADVAKKRAEAAKGRTPPEPAKGKQKFNDDEAGMEFKRGGAIRGAGMARPKKTRFI